MNLIRYNELREREKGPYADRILSEIAYCEALSRAHGGVYDALLTRAVDDLRDYVAAHGAITKEAVEIAERTLTPLSSRVKQDTVLLVAHAHIDMNWLWGWEETVAATLSTFRTMLNLMKEYPEFTFSQSQASVYEIAERYDRDMLEEIRARIREGRWEVTASTWVETDKNMVNGEGLARHILQTKRYLKSLLGLREEDFAIDFEPDSFGHGANLPEILSKGGIGYYYHCRGRERTGLYRWVAPSGASVLSYCEPFWYNSEICAYDFCGYPAMLAEYGMHRMIKVYGVGDHGGGATRRDLRRIAEYRTWPLLPNFEFSTFREFFAYADANAKSPERVCGELNPVFTGCYTSQTRIKSANRAGERAFCETEKLLAFCPEIRAQEELDRAWRIHLFNHFHDILPGSGVRATREHALGCAQERDAVLGSLRARATRALAKTVNTDFLRGGEQSGASASGYGVNGVVCPSDLSDDDERAYLICNGAATRKHWFDISLWEYAYDSERIAVYSADGAALPFEVLDRDPVPCYGFTYRRVRVKADVPANGYTVAVVRADRNPSPAPPWSGPGGTFDRMSGEARYVLDNGVICAEFDAETAALVRRKDYRTGVETVWDGVHPLAWFEHGREDASSGLSAWVTGRTLTEKPLTENVRMHAREAVDGALRKYFSYTVSFGASEADVTVSLDGDNDYLTYDVRVVYRDFGECGKVTPYLQYSVASDDTLAYTYDNALGTVTRSAADSDRAGLSFVYNGGEAGGLLLTSDSKYGFRAFGDKMSVKLIRASSDPDLFSENYEHRMRLFLRFADRAVSKKELIEKAEDCNAVCEATVLEKGTGTRAATDSLFTIAGDVALSSVKRSDDGTSVVVRVYETEGKQAAVSLHVDGMTEACYATLSEECLAPVAVRDGTASFEVAPYSVCTVRLTVE